MILKTTFSYFFKIFYGTKLQYQIGQSLRKILQQMKVGQSAFF